jgi:threonine/homoserine/homoserine lactone efflux protein
MTDSGVPEKGGAGEGGRQGFWVVVVGLLVVLTAFIVAVLRYEQAAQAATALGPVTAVVGTLVGAYFGVRVGSAGREKAEAARQVESNKVQKLAAAAAPGVATQVLGVEARGVGVDR